MPSPPQYESHLWALYRKRAEEKEKKTQREAKNKLQREEKKKKEAAKEESASVDLLPEDLLESFAEE